MTILLKGTAGSLSLTPSIRKKLGAALGTFSMIHDGDRVMVGVSGGKDSLLLLEALLQFRRYSPVSFGLAACTLDMTGGLFDVSPFRSFCESRDVPFFLRQYPILDIVKSRNERSPCSLCATLRRGILSSATAEEGYNVLALGHNFDDAIETALLNLLETGRFRSFQPKIWQTRSSVWVIRPLVFASEDAIRDEAGRLGLPVRKNPCPYGEDTRRKEVKLLIKSLGTVYPNIRNNMMHAPRSIDGADSWRDRTAPLGHESEESADDREH